MALPDFVGLVAGTTIVWGEAGASGVTHTLSFNNLASGATQQGASADLGLSLLSGTLILLPEFVIVEFGVETGTAPTAGNTCSAFLIASTDNTWWPAKVTGSNGAYTRGTLDANLRQAGTPAVTLVATNDGTTTLRQVNSRISPNGRYIAPIISNDLGQAIRNETTATNNDSRLRVTPYYAAVVEALS